MNTTMKYIFGVLFVFLAIATPLHAADPVRFTAVPSETQAPLAVGDPILIYAALNNTLPDPITYVVAFTALEKTIGTKVVTVPGYTGQDISIPWTLPAEATTVTATIAKATDAKKVEMKAFVGPIGTVQVGVDIDTPRASAIKGWVGDIVTTLETFRTDQLAAFDLRKKDAQQVLSRTTIKDVGDLLKPEPITESNEVVQVEKKDNGTTIGYLKLMYATAGKAFFEHKAVYFVAIILVVLVVIRMIFRLLLR